MRSFTSLSFEFQRDKVQPLSYTMKECLGSPDAGVLFVSVLGRVTDSWFLWDN